MQVTHPDQLLPIGIVHVHVEGLLTCTLGLVSSGRRYLIESYPKGLDDFAFKQPGAGYEAGRKPGKALILVAMNMKEAYTPKELHVLRYIEGVGLEASFEKM